VSAGRPLVRTIDALAAKRVKFVVLDVDGVLTDGGIFLGDVDGRRMEFKKYDIQDGLGILLLRWAGIKVGIITGRVSESVALRAAELKVDELVQDEQARKLPALRKICQRLDIGLEEVAFIGDDLPDVSVLREVGLPVVVGNATADAVNAACESDTVSTNRSLRRILYFANTPSKPRSITRSSPNRPAVTARTRVRKSRPPDTPQAFSSGLSTPSLATDAPT